MSEVSVFEISGWNQEQANDYMRQHNALPQKLATLLSMKASSPEECAEVDQMIADAKHFIKAIVEKLDNGNLPFYMNFSQRTELSDAEMSVYKSCFKRFVESTNILMMDPVIETLRKLCKKFTAEQIMNALE